MLSTFARLHAGAAARWTAAAAAAAAGTPSIASRLYSTATSAAAASEISLAAAAAAAKPQYFEVSLVRSLIGLPPRTIQVAKSLGLRRKGWRVYCKIHERNAGKILKVKELVTVRNVVEAGTNGPIKSPAAKGYSVIGNVRSSV
ncbi:hypothetical protein GQ42DRAFT_165583 [Ramicandelaber brevisporus]|nr:hypothetical protein GQ42DRAFT_165583 [Ramicandelaber brevisporus]